MSTRLKNLGLEAVAVQTVSQLYVGTVAIFEKLKGKKVSLTDLKKSGILELVKKETNIPLTLGLSEVPWNAYALPPAVDKNHPLIADQYRRELGDFDMIRELYRKGGAVDGYVDLKEGKVYGVFEKMPVSIYLPQNLFVNPKISAHELAAIFVHEIGHIFTLYELLGRSLSANMAIEATVRAMFDKEARYSKVEVLDGYKEMRGLKFEDKQAILNEKRKDGVRLLLLQAELEEGRSSSGSRLYDETAFEAMSDQFATRHGGGVHLVTALDKRLRYGKDPVFSNPFKFYGLEMLKMTLATMILLGGSPVLIAGAIIKMAGTNPHESTYDKPQDRVNRIKRDLVQTLKNKDLTKEAREALVKDIEVIDSVAADMTQRTTVYELAWSLISPKTRRGLKLKEFQQMIEEQMSNDLFVDAAKFKML